MDCDEVNVAQVSEECRTCNSEKGFFAFNQRKWDEIITQKITKCLLDPKANARLTLVHLVKFKCIKYFLNKLIFQIMTMNENQVDNINSAVLTECGGEVTGEFPLMTGVAVKL